MSTDVSSCMSHDSIKFLERDQRVRARELTQENYVSYPVDGAGLECKRAQKQSLNLNLDSNLGCDMRYGC